MTLCSLELCGIRDTPVQYKLSIRVTGMSRMRCRIVKLLSKTASEGKTGTSSPCSSLLEDAGVDVKLYWYCTARPSCCESTLASPATGWNDVSFSWLSAIIGIAGRCEHLMGLSSSIWSIHWMRSIVPFANEKWCTLQVEKIEDFQGWHTPDAGVNLTRKHKTCGMDYHVSHCLTLTFVDCKAVCQI